MTPGCCERFIFYVSGIWWHLLNLWGSREKPLCSASVRPCLSLVLASWVTLISLSVLWTPLAVTLLCLAYLSRDIQFPKPSLIPQRSRELNSPAFDVSFLLHFCPDKSQSHSSWGHRGPYFPLCPSLYYSLLTLTCLQEPVFCLLSSTKGTSSSFELQRSYLPAKPKCPLSTGQINWNHFLTSVNSEEGDPWEFVPWGFCHLPLCFGWDKGILSSESNSAPVLSFTDKWYYF